MTTDQNERLGLPSTAALGGHPLHPLLVTLPVGFLVGALLTDIGFFASGDPFWTRASVWLIGAGLVAGAIAALAGFIDFFGSARIRSIRIVWYHWIGNAAALLLSALSLYLRLAQATPYVTGGQIILSVLVVLIFAVTGWLGGELVFRHGVGQIRDAREGWRDR